MAHVGEKRDAYRVLVGRLKNGDHFYYPRVNGEIILKWASRSKVKRRRLNMHGAELGVSVKHIYLYEI